MHIRSAMLNDLHPLCAINTAGNSAKRRDEIAAWIDAACCYIVEIDDQIAAYGVLNYHFFGCAFVELVMVTPSYRRLGMGLALVGHFQAMCRREKLFTSTNLSNRPMQALLGKAGFMPSGQIDNLDGGDPELIFYCPPHEAEGDR